MLGDLINRLLSNALPPNHPNQVTRYSKKIRLQRTAALIEKPVRPDQPDKHLVRHFFGYRTAARHVQRIAK